MLQLRYYQKDAIDSFFEYTSQNHGKHPLVIIPTAGGKSLVMAYIIRTMLAFPNTRILMVTHQQELIKQNYLELVENFNNEVFLDVGIYSAGLKCRDTSNRIIFAGIQSVYKKAWHLGWFDLILIDEAHLISHKGEGMYREFLGEMEKINPNVVIGGLTATGYRMKEGILTEGEGALFHDICYEATIAELINPNHLSNRDRKQYLCKLISKSAVSKADLSNVHIRGGEYIPQEMEAAFMEGDLVCRAIKEVQDYAYYRKKILIFTAGIKHCEEVTRKMIDMGMDARCIHSQKPEEENNQNIQDFKDGKLRFLLNVKKLTTGFNEKAMDCIVFMFSTKSPGLYYQCAGRGLRLHPDKTDCLILDFGRNIETHGPIDKIEIRKNKKTGKKEVQTAPQKECPKCQSLLHLSIMICPDCGYEFPEKEKHEDEASTENILSEWKKPEMVEVVNVAYGRHQKQGKPDSMRVDYYINIYERHSTWVCIEHGGFARKKALQWLSNVTKYDIDTVEEALDLSTTFRVPTHIIVDTNEKYPRITGYIYSDDDPIPEPILDSGIENATERIWTDDDIPL